MTNILYHSGHNSMTKALNIHEVPIKIGPAGLQLTVS